MVILVVVVAGLVVMVLVVIVVVVVVVIVVVLVVFVVVVAVVVAAVAAAAAAAAVADVVVGVVVAAGVVAVAVVVQGVVIATVTRTRSASVGTLPAVTDSKGHVHDIVCISPVFCLPLSIALPKAFVPSDGQVLQVLSRTSVRIDVPRDAGKPPPVGNLRLGLSRRGLSASTGQTTASLRLK